MNAKKSLLCLLAAAQLLMLAACGGKTDDGNVTDSGQNYGETEIPLGISDASAFSEGSIYEGVCYDLSGIAPDTVVYRMGGTDVPMDMYFYWLNYSCTYLQSFMEYYLQSEIDWEGEVVAGQTAAEYVTRDTVQTLRTMIGTELFAQKNGITLDRAELDELAAQRQDYIDTFGSEEEYLNQLAGIGLREETYDRICTTEMLYSKCYALYNEAGSPLYPSDEVLVEFAQQRGYLAADHLLLLTKDTVTGEVYDDVTIAQQRQRAEEYLVQIRESDTPEETFRQLADAHSEDTGRPGNPEGYTFGTGEMVPEFENGTRALAVGEISEIIASDYGYHIILRKPLLVENVKAKVSDAYFESLQLQYVPETEMIRNPILDTMDIRAVYEGFLTLQQEMTDSTEEHNHTEEEHDHASEEQAS